MNLINAATRVITAPQPVLGESQQNRNHHFIWLHLFQNEFSKSLLINVRKDNKKGVFMAHMGHSELVVQTEGL